MANFSKLFELLDEKGMSIKRLAKETGISSSNIYFWKSGERNPSATAVKILSDYFNVSTDYLLGSEKPIQNSEFSEKEIEIMRAYRNSNMKEAVDRLLSVNNKNEIADDIVRTVKNSNDFFAKTLTKQEQK